MKQLRLHLLVLALVAGLLVPVTAFARVLALCNMAGGSGKVCCCHKDGRDEEQCRRPAIDRAPCCTLLISEAERAAATHTGSASDVPPAALLERLPAVEHGELSLASGARFAPRARGPPASGPPIFLRDCRILS